MKESENNMIQAYEEDLEKVIQDELMNRSNLTKE